MQIIQTTYSEVIARLNKNVHDLHVSLYPHYFKDYQFETANEFFKTAIENPSNYFYVLEDNGQYLGYAWVELREYKGNVFMNSYKSVFIHQFSINKEHQKQGLGSQLMNKVYELAKKHGGTENLFLKIWYNNDIKKIRRNVSCAERPFRVSGRR